MPAVMAFQKIALSQEQLQQVERIARGEREFLRLGSFELLRRDPTFGISLHHFTKASRRELATLLTEASSKMGIGTQTPEPSVLSNFSEISRRQSRHLVDGMKLDNRNFYLARDSGETFPHGLMMVIIPLALDDIEHFENLLLATGVTLQILANSQDRLQQVALTAIDNDSSLNFARKDERIAPVDKPSYMAIWEGIVSLHQLLVALSIHQHPSLNRQQVIESVLRRPEGNGTTLASRIASQFSLGVLGPMNQLGQFPSPLIDTQRRDKVSLNPLFLSEMQRQRNELQISATTEYAAGYGCPMSYYMAEHCKSGIDALAEIYLRIYQRVYRLRLNSAQSLDSIESLLNSYAPEFEYNGLEF
ncbi:MAG: hypothetical protein HRT45_09530 [Bdellovibrionales bacterium]|nr:hypothetical protein [Bdellovibrionales bacterium]